MPVSQLLTTVGRSNWPDPVIYFNSTEVAWLPSPSPVVSTITFPDASTGRVLEFDGSNHTISNSLGAISDFYLNLWFYPNSLSCILMSEFEYPDETVTSYHYTMLELSSGYVKARTWDMASPWLTSAAPVTLNAWNHVYLYYTAGSVGVELNGASAVTGSVTRSAPGNTYLGVGVVDSTNMGSTSRYSGYINDLVITTSTAPSLFNLTKAKYGY